jgi:long-chain acyl-CoA synthetase
LETALKKYPIIDDVVIVGENRPYITALIVPDISVLPEGENQPERSVDLVQAAIDEVNTLVSRPEQIKKFALVPPFDPKLDQMTNSAKVRRNAVTKAYADTIDGLY